MLRRRVPRTIGTPTMLRKCSSPPPHRIRLALTPAESTGDPLPHPPTPCVAAQLYPLPCVPCCIGLFVEGCRRRKRGRRPTSRQERYIEKLAKVLPACDPHRRIVGDAEAYSFQRAGVPAPPECLRAKTALQCAPVFASRYDLQALAPEVGLYRSPRSSLRIWATTDDRRTRRRRGGDRKRAASPRKLGQWCSIG